MDANTVSNSHRSIRKRISRTALAAAGPMLGFLLIAAAPASAADVGVVVDTPHGANAKVRSAPSTDANVVDVLRDGTRLPDAECLVRTADTSVWTKLTGDRYIRADLTGYDTRLPMCNTASQVHQSPDAIDRPATPQGEQMLNIAFREAAPPPGRDVSTVEKWALKYGLVPMLEVNKVIRPYEDCLVNCSWSGLADQFLPVAGAASEGCLAGITGTNIKQQILTRGYATIPSSTYGCVVGVASRAGLVVYGVNGTKLP